MKVNSNKDSVELSHASKAKKGDKAAAAGKAKSAESTGASAGVGNAAGVEISSEAKAMAEANKIAKSDSVDQAKVDRIKGMIKNGTYSPDMGKVADKMINESLLEAN